MSNQPPNEDMQKAVNDVWSMTFDNPPNPIETIELPDISSVDIRALGKRINKGANPKRCYE